MKEEVLNKVIILKSGDEKIGKIPLKMTFECPTLGEVKKMKAGTTVSIERPTLGCQK